MKEKLGTKTRKPRTKPEKAELSSGNIFADLGFQDADERLLKAKLASQVAQFIEKKGWTQSRVVSPHFALNGTGRGGRRQNPIRADHLRRATGFSRFRLFNCSRHEHFIRPLVCGACHGVGPVSATTVHRQRNPLLGLDAHHTRRD
jgi:hypothetical protein